MVRLAAIVLAAGLAYGVAGTGAWFTSSDQSATNTLEAAQLNIDMRENGGRFGGAVAQEIKYLAPGVPTPWAYTESVNIFNEISAANGGLDVKYRLSAPYQGGSGALYNLMWVEVRDQYFPGPVCGEAGALIYEGPLSGFSVMNDVGRGHGMLPAGNSHKFCLQFTLSSAADNSLQGATADFLFVASATQLEAPDPL
jgi:hypothetical protein